jgi:hypothetical protein
VIRNFSHRGAQRSRGLAAVLLACLGLACQTTELRESAGVLDSPPVSSAAEVGFELRCGGKRCGTLIHYQEQGSGSRRSFYSVRNELDQAIGLIDVHGRAYRFRPHQAEAEWLGTGTVLEGAQRILGSDGPCELVELRLAQVSSHL